MIFERMSEECIGSLVTAQNESARLSQPTVGCEVMTLGIIDHRSSREHRRELLPMPAIRPRCIPNQWGIWIYTLTGASEDGKCLTYYAVTKC